MTLVSTRDSPYQDMFTPDIYYPPPIHLRLLLLGRFKPNLGPGYFMNHDTRIPMQYRIGVKNETAFSLYYTYFPTPLN